ncbi:MAG: transposase [Candidatus Jettenia sp. CY-1]|nr:MAG: transposase [Candidatus Jettenia sp. CY-1]
MVARRAKRGRITLSEEDREYLEGIAKSRTASFREVERAKIMLSHLEGKTDKGIAQEIGIHRFTVKNCLDKCSSMGMEAALRDLPRPGAPAKITEVDKMFIVNRACKKPWELGYPYELWTYVKIRLILDNHSAHISKETRRYLETQPNRFEFVFTPKHGSWLNLIEVFFSKMTRSFLRGIRVSSISELIKRMEMFFF